MDAVNIFTTPMEFEDAVRAVGSHALNCNARRALFHYYIQNDMHRAGRGFKSLRRISAELGGAIPKNTVWRWLKKHYPATARRMFGVPHLRPIQ